MTLLIGSDDEINIASAFEPLLAKQTPNLTIGVLPDVAHINLLSTPRALQAITKAVASRDAQEFLASTSTSH
jgi:hypothetical protein